LRTVICKNKRQYKSARMKTNKVRVSKSNPVSKPHKSSNQTLRPNSSKTTTKTTP